MVLARVSLILVPVGLVASLFVLPIRAQLVRGAFGDASPIRIDAPASPQPGDIVINEVYPRPFPSGSEFIELFNRSVHTFDLHDLTIRDASSLPFFLSEEEAKFFPGAYTVLVADEIAFSNRFAGVPDIAPARWASLNNGGDAVILESGGVIIDSLFYAGSVVEAGRSLERIDPGAPSDPYNFALSVHTSGATPGMENSRYAPDTSGPVLSFAKVFNDTQLDLYFNEPVRTGTISPASVRLENLVAQAVKTLGPTRLRVFYADTVTGVSVAVGQVSDLRGNISERVSAPISYRPVSQDIVVNEILYEPLTNDYDGLANQVEFVELVNRSARRIYLDGIYRTRDADEYGDADTVHVQGRFIGLGPGEYLLLAAASMENENAPVITGNGLTLLNQGDRIRIHRQDGEVLDDIRYDPSWHHPDVLETRGITLERIDVDGSGNHPQNWTSSVGASGGTPGLPNSIRIADQDLLSERGIQITPNPFSPDRDGVDDIVRIKCTFSSDISRIRALVFDLAGNQVRRLVASRLVAESVELLWNGRDDADRRLRTGIYIAFVEAYDARNNVMDVFKAPIVLARRY